MLVPKSQRESQPTQIEELNEANDTFEEGYSDEEQEEEMEEEEESENEPELQHTGYSDSEFDEEGDAADSAEPSLALSLPKKVDDYEEEEVFCMKFKKNLILQIGIFIVYIFYVLSTAI